MQSSYMSNSLVFSLCPDLSFPCRVTREHRENLAKLAKQFSNKAKDSLRKVRSNAVAQVKKAKEGHSEDTIRLVEKQVGDVGKKRDNVEIKGRHFVLKKSGWDIRAQKPMRF